MPNFTKSKGFQLKSGNKAKAPFKMMGSSSPAKGGFTIPGADGGTSAIDAFTTKTKNKEIVAPEVKKVEKDKVRVMTEKESKMKQDGKLGTVVSRTAKKIGKSIKKGAKNFGKAMQDPENQQKMRDLGARISSIGNREGEESMVSVIQGQADRKQNQANKDIQNEKDKVSTARNKQIIDQHNKEASGEAELPEDDSKAATNIKGSTMTDLSKNK